MFYIALLQYVSKVYGVNLMRSTYFGDGLGYPRACYGINVVFMEQLGYGYFDEFFGRPKMEECFFAYAEKL